MPTRPRLRLLLALLTALIAASSLATVSAFAAPTTRPLADVPWASAANGLGPVERNRANGGGTAGDGRLIRLDGQIFDRGLGVAAESDLTYALGGQCAYFAALVGLDDSAAEHAKAVIVIYLDERMIFSSGEVTRAAPSTRLSFPVAGAQSLRLRVTSYDDPTGDLVSWANARLTCAVFPGPDAPSATPAPTPPAPTGTLPPAPTAAPGATAPPAATALPTTTPVPPPGGGGTSPSTATAWGRWEQRLSATQPAVNPATDVTLRVRYTGPGGQAFESQGFWDGGSSFIIRALFPTSGTWAWETTASSGDTGLTQRGTVQVGAARGTPLQTRGLLRVSADGRALTHADGTPFFWLGDTVWDAPLKATDAEWMQYLADRAAKGFSVVQIALAPRWAAAADRQGNAAFIGSNLRQPNPAFWRAFERKVQLANDAGLAVLVVGLMDPLAQNQADVTAAQIVGRYVAARLASSHVILSPSFDHPYRSMAEQTALAIQAVVPNHLITQHPGTPSGQATNVWAEQYADHPTLAILGLQSGHNRGDRALVFGQAVRWTQSLARRQPARPVINLEAYYDAGGLVPASAGGVYQGTAWDARAAGYLSLLSGASGYTYGAYGLWSWGGEPVQAVPWRTALALPSSRQMAILRQVVTSIPWWQLRPAPERVLTVTNNPTRQPVLAITSDGTAGIAYLPAALPVQLDLGGFRRTLQASWVDPQTGARTPIGAVTNGGSQTFTPPAGGIDWVLVFEG